MLMVSKREAMNSLSKCSSKNLVMAVWLSMPASRWYQQSKLSMVMTPLKSMSAAHTVVTP